MKHLLFLLAAGIMLYSCNGQSKFTPKVTFIIQPPVDAFVHLMRAPDSVTVYKLHTKYDAYWNDTIIDRGVKLSKREYHTKGAGEFFSGNYINWTFMKYKATDYYIKMEYWFEYFDKPKNQR
jgi:hypothetical protein